MENKETKTYKHNKAKIGKNYHKYTHKIMKILAMSTVFKADTISSIHTARNPQPWDSDSGLIGIDNR